MAVSTTHAFSGPYTANGATTVFPFTFTAPSASEVSVIVQSDAGAETAIAPDSYAVSLSDGGGGSVTFTTAPQAGLILYVMLDPVFTQELEFEDGSPWIASPVNEGYDRAAARDQVIKRDVDRAILAPVGETGIVMPSSTTRASGFLAFDADGDPISSSGTGADAGLRTDLADPASGAALVGFKAPSGAAILRTVLEKLGDVVHVKDFGAACDGTTDDTVALQAAIDFCKAGALDEDGNLLRSGLGALLIIDGICKTGPITLRSGVFLTGPRYGIKGGTTNTPKSGATLTPVTGSIPDDGFLITFENAIDEAGIVGLNIIGTGSTSKTGAILGNTGGGCTIAYNNIINWGIECIVSRHLNICRCFENITIGLANRTYCVARGYATGSIRLEAASPPGGVDWTIFNNEFSGSSNNSASPYVSSGGIYLAAAYYAGLAAASVYGNRYQVGDTAISYFGDSNRYSHETYDTIAGHGLYCLSGDSNLFVNCTLSRVGFGGVGSYDGIYVPSTATFNRNRFIGLKCELGTPVIGSTYTTYRSLINDLKASGSTDYYNHYAQILAPRGATALFSGAPFVNAGAGGASFTVAHGSGAVQNGATPDAFNTDFIVVGNGSPVSITNFLNGAAGQRLLVIPNEITNTSVAHGASVFLRAGRGAKLLRTATEFIKLSSGAWDEIGPYQREALASVTPGTIAAGAVTAIATVALTDASLGDSVTASWALDLQGVRLNAWVSAANTVSYQFHNPTAGSVALTTAANLRVKLVQFAT